MQKTRPLKVRQYQQVFEPSNGGDKYLLHLRAIINGLKTRVMWGLCITKSAQIAIQKTK